MVLEQLQVCSACAASCYHSCEPRSLTVRPVSVLQASGKDLKPHVGKDRSLGCSHAADLRTCWLALAAEA
jgi:hypothetical protein